MLFVLGIAAGVILVLAMFGKIKWESRNSLIIYTYIMTGIIAFGAFVFKIHIIYKVQSSSGGGSLVLLHC